jgi:SNF2 family DNA or RNA helicase
MVLTGTPMVNHAADIFGILHFLKPSEYPKYDSFVSEYFFVSYFRRHVRVEKKNGELMEFTLIIPKVLGYKSKEKKEKLQILLNQFSTQRTQDETMP